MTFSYCRPGDLDFGVTHGGRWCRGKVSCGVFFLDRCGWVGVYVEELFCFFVFVIFLFFGFFSWCYRWCAIT